jgi:DNA-binding CsgD family transcriptional regulator
LRFRDRGKVKVTDKRSTETELLDRQSELAALTAALAAAQVGDPSVVWVEGAPGIGKTRLLEATVAQAEQMGFVVLDARCSDLEQEFAFGVVRQLFERYVNALAPAEHESAFAGAAGLARPALGDAIPADDATHPVLHGLYWLTANIAVETPVLIAVDDLQWCDAASIRWLHYLVRRLETLPIVVLVAARESARAAQLEALRAEARIVLGPDPLSDGAVQTLVRGWLGPKAAAELCAACGSATQGNPFLLIELVRALKEQGVEPSARGAALVEQLGPISISRSVLLRLAAASPRATRLASAASVLGDGSRVGHAATLAGLSSDEIAEAADAMIACHVLSSAEPIQFTHPVVRSAIYADLPEGERARMHAHASSILAAAGRPLEERAAHLLRTLPSGDRLVVEELRAAAGVALSRGVPEAAVTYLARALSEPPAAADRPAVLLALGHAQMLGGEPAALERLREAVAESTDAQESALATRDLARLLTLVGRPGEAVAALRSGLERLGTTDRRLRLALANDLALAARVDPSGAFPAAERTRLLQELLDDEAAERLPEERLLLSNLAVEETMAGKPADHCALLAERALADGALLATETADSGMFLIAVCVLIFADRFELAAELLTAALEDAQSRGSILGSGQISGFLALLQLRRGELRDAEAEAQSAVSSLGNALPQLAPIAVACLVECLRERGELDWAEAILEEGGLAGELGAEYHNSHLLEARGQLRLAQSRHESALADFLEAGRRLEALGMVNPAIAAWRSGAALALAALGDAAQASQLAGEELALAKQFGAPRALGVAQRVAGLVTPGEPGRRLLRRAVATLAESSAPLEHARALVDLGGALRRANRKADARSLLTSGLELAQRCGACALAERAIDELSAAGARRPRRLQLEGRDALTPSELRIARLAAGGKTNREIAQLLFLTIKTVEGHLRQAYRKLGVGGRPELAARLGSDAGDERGGEESQQVKALVNSC